MSSLIQAVEQQFMKKNVVDVKSGDTVKVHQKIKEGGKERIQIFEGLVIRVSRKQSLTSSFTVRRIASGVGVEKTFMIHAPNIIKIVVTKRSKVRRNYLSYMRELTGKSARLAGRDFDRESVNAVPEEEEKPGAEVEDELSAENMADEASQEELPSESEAKDKSDKKQAEKIDQQKSAADKIEEKPKQKADAEQPAQPENKT